MDRKQRSLRSQAYDDEDERAWSSARKVSIAWLSCAPAAAIPSWSMSARQRSSRASVSSGSGSGCGRPVSDMYNRLHQPQPSRAARFLAAIPGALQQKLRILRHAQSIHRALRSARTASQRSREPARGVKDLPARAASSYTVRKLVVEILGITNPGVAGLNISKACFASPDTSMEIVALSNSPPK